MPRVLALILCLHSFSCIKDNHFNKRNNLLFVEKYEKPINFSINWQNNNFSLE